jgi:hypothetical protein
MLSDMSRIKTVIGIAAAAMLSLGASLTRRH